jgi:hypothetical protein
MPWAAVYQGLSSTPLRIDTKQTSESPGKTKLNGAGSTRQVLTPDDTRVPSNHITQNLSTARAPFLIEMLGNAL